MIIQTVAVHLPGLVDCYTADIHTSLQSFSLLPHQHSDLWRWSFPDEQTCFHEVVASIHFTVYVSYCYKTLFLLYIKLKHWEHCPVSSTQNSLCYASNNSSYTMTPPCPPWATAGHLHSTFVPTTVHLWERHLNLWDSLTACIRKSEEMLSSKTSFSTILWALSSAATWERIDASSSFSLWKLGNN